MPNASLEEVVEDEWRSFLNRTKLFALVRDTQGAKSIDPSAVYPLLPTLTAPRQLPEPHLLSLGTAVCTIDICTVIGNLKKLKTSKPNISIVTMQVSFWFTAGYILSARGPASRY